MGLLFHIFLLQLFQLPCAIGSKDRARKLYVLLPHSHVSCRAG